VRRTGVAGVAPFGRGGGCGYVCLMLLEPFSRPVLDRDTLGHRVIAYGSAVLGREVL